MTRSSSGALVATAVSVALLGCGSTGRPAGEPTAGPGEARVRAVVTRYFEAARAGDTGRMCATLTEELERHVARLQATSCEKALSAELRNLPESLMGYEVTPGGVRIDGRTATVSLDGPGGEDRMTLERRGRVWTIATAPGMGV